MKLAVGALFVISSLTVTSLPDTFPSSPAGWVILILVGVPAYLLVQYAMEMADARVEDRRERNGINTTGVRALVMLLAGVSLVPPFYFGLVFALSRFQGP